MESLSDLRDQLVADETRDRRIRSGICKGCYLPINLRHDVRMLFGVYEREISGVVRSYVGPGFCCYDIGAAVGYYTMALARLTSPGRVYAMETDELLSRSLETTIAHNGHIRSEMQVLNCFMGDVADPANKRMTMDYLVFQEGLSPPDFVKIDVDGPEYAVLQGAREVIRRFAPKFVVEVHSEELEAHCRSLLEREGYEVMPVSQSTIFPDLRPIPHNRWLCAERA